MWIKSSGELSESVYQLNTVVSSHFLVYSDDAAIIDSGISSTAEQLIEGIKQYLPESSLLRYILVTHTHFDHIGGIPYLRRYAPEAELLCSPEAAEILRKQETLEERYRQNRECAEAMGREMGLSEEAWYAAFKVNRIIGDGDIIDLGDGVDIKLIESPGHTIDSVSYYIRADSALVGGETVGYYAGRDKLYAAFMESYQSYTESLEKLALLDVRILGFPHGGALTGDIPAKYLVDARMAAEKFAATIRERLEQGGLVDEVYREMLAEWQHENISPDGPFVESQAECLRKMIQSVAHGT